jgi:hypothetical protein
VYAVDVSPEKIARSKKKAKRDGVEGLFRNGLAETLPSWR